MSEEIFPDNSYGDDYLTQKKRKFRDEDQDGFDDNWEMEQGIHDKFNKHKRPGINVGGILKSYNGVIAVDNEYLKPIKRTGQSLKVNNPKKMRMNIDIKSPNWKGGNLKKIPIPKATGKSIKYPKFEVKMTGVTNILNGLLGKKRKKRI